MVQQKVQPNLLTFNSVLKTLRRCGALGRGVSLQVLSEMKALNIGKKSLKILHHSFKKTKNIDVSGSNGCKKEFLQLLV